MGRASAYASATVSVWLCATVRMHAMEPMTGDPAGAFARPATTIIERPHR